MSVLQSPPRQNSVWPAAAIAVGLGLSLSWVLLLGYGLFRLVAYAV